MTKAPDDPFTDFDPQDIQPEAGQPLIREPEQQEHFPTYALGRVLGDAVRAIEDRVQCPVAIAGQSVLAAATLAVQGHADVRLPVDGPDAHHPLSELFATVAVSGERKTSADTLALAPVRQREQKLRDIYKSTLPVFLNKHEAWEAARASAKKKIKDLAALQNALDAIGREPEPPLHPVLANQDFTFEGLRDNFRDGEASQGIFTSEGGAVLGGHAMREETILRTSAGLSEFWDGTPLQVLRGSKIPTILVGRRLTVHLMIQPVIAPRLFKNRDLVGTGLTSRILAAAPPSNIGQRDAMRREARTTEPALATYCNHLLDILRRRLPLEPGTRNQLKAPVLALDPAADQLWREFANFAEQNCALGGDFEGIRPLANKIAEHAARIAGVLTLIDNIDAVAIGEARLEDGIELAQFYLTEALRLIGDLDTEPHIKEAELLLEWIRTNKATAETDKQTGERLVALIDVYQKGPPAFRTKAEASAGILVLEDHKWLARAPGGCVVNGTMRADVWRLSKQ
jgi:hypothetical protein